ncbi:hypothetical protein LXL04_035319 [Taraxacum kok-saghyz]
MGLNESYKGIRGQILMMNPLPSIATVHSLLIHEERQRDITSVPNIIADSLAMNVNSHNSNTSSNKRNLQCTYCKKTGHVKAQCYRINGFPNDFKFTKTKRTDSAAHNVVDNTTPDAATNSTNVVPPISADQYQQLIQMLSLNNKTTQVNSVITDGVMDSSGTILDTQGKHVSYVFNVIGDTEHQHSSWIIDSGATNHIFCDQNLFSTLSTFSQSHFLSLTNGQSLCVSQSRRVPIHEDITLNDVLYVPQFKHNLISVTNVTSQLKVWVLFTDEFAVMQAPLSKSSLIIGKRVNNLYIREFKLLKTLQILSFILSNDCNHSLDSCEIYSQARQHSMSFSNTETTSDHAFDLIHIDIWGPYKVPTYNGHKYFLTVVDDHTRCTWVHLLKNKSGTFSIIKAFITYTKVQFKAEVKIVRTDNAFELGSCLEGRNFFESSGIIHQNSCPYKPQQNGVVERKHKHLLEVSRALFFQSGLGKSYWGDCVLTAAYIINRTPLKVLNNSSPYEDMFKHKPDLSNLKTFGVISGSRDVKFIEDVYPLHNLSSFNNQPGYFPVDVHDDEVPLNNANNQGEVQDEPQHAETVYESEDDHQQDEVQGNPVNQNIPAHEYAEQRRTTPNSIHKVVELSFYNQAKYDPLWQAAMKKEFEALEANNTWEIVSLPKGKRHIACKWVYKVKYKADGSIERYKARLVATGFTQQEGIDYHETFFPVVKFNIVWCLVALAVKRHWPIHQFDVNNAFLHGDLHAEVFMRLPHYYKTSLMRPFGCNLLTIVAFDIEKVDVEEKKGKPFVTESENSTLVILFKHKFIRELLDQYDISNAHNVKSPLPTNIKDIHSSSVLLEDPSPNRQLVGKLNFLVHTRPDIAFTTQFLSQFNHKPTQKHIEAALHVLKYLQGTITQCLLFNNSDDFKLEAFCDSDWAACPNTRRSVSGFFVTLRGSPISWKSKEQSTVSLLSAEAEYRSMRRICSELTWLNRLLAEFEIPNIIPIPLKCDNLAAIYIAKNPVFHERTKHIDIDFHFVREKVLEGLISLSHILTKQQPADVFTKALGGKDQEEALSKLGFVPQFPS